MRRLTGGELTREMYAETLAAMYRPHLRLERLVHDSNHHVESGLALSARRQLLEADLLALGWPIPACTIAHVPLDPSLGRAAWWGRLYVLEGSRQGGAVIAKCITRSLGNSAPRRFLGEEYPTDKRNALRARLETELEHDADLDQAVASAGAAFADYLIDLEAFPRGTHGIDTVVEIIK